MPRYLPFDPGPHRHRVGTRTLDPRTWIELGPDADAQMEEKRRVLACHGEDVVRVLDGPPGPGTTAVLDACVELLEALESHLQATFPERYARGASGVLVDPRSGTPWVDPALGGLHPIDRAARLVPEDLCLHLPGPDGVLRLVAASVAFPSRWVLAEKMGQAVAQIHAPVPGYDPAIASPVDRLLDKLPPGRGMWRLNGSVLDDATLFQPTGRRRTVAGTVPDDIVLRVERQTLRRLPVSGAVVFTIRTVIDPLTSLADDPDACRQVRDWLRGLPGDLLSYKSLGATGPAVLAWLDARC